MAKETYNRYAILSTEEIRSMQVARFKQLEYLRGVRRLTKGEKKEYLQLINDSKVQKYLRSAYEVDELKKNAQELKTI